MPDNFRRRNIAFCLVIRVDRECDPKHIIDFLAGICIRGVNCENPIETTFYKEFDADRSVFSPKVFKIGPCQVFYIVDTRGL